MPGLKVTSQSNHVSFAMQHEEPVPGTLPPGLPSQQLKVDDLSQDQFKISVARSAQAMVSLPSQSQITISRIHDLLSAPLVEASFGIPTYKPWDKGAIIALLQGWRPLIEAGELNINAPIVSNSPEPRYCGYPPLAAAAREPDVAIVRELLQLKTIDLSAHDSRLVDPLPFRTVLMHAVRGALFSNSTAVLELLLADERMGRCINEICTHRNGEKWTALDIAKDFLRARPESCAPAVIALLEAKGAIAVRDP